MFTPIPISELTSSSHAATYKTSGLVPKLISGRARRSDLKRKKLFISQAFPPQKNSTAQLLDYFFQTHEAFFDDWEVFAPKSPVDLYPINPVGPQPTTGLSRVWFALLVFTKLLWSRPSLMLSTTNPPFLIWILGFWGRIKKIPFGFLILDLYPDCLIQTHVLKEKSFTSKVWKILNGWAFKRAQYIWVIGRDMEKKVSQEYKIDASRITYMPLWAPFKQPEYIDGDVSLPIKICYSGNIGLLSDLEPLLMAAKELQDQPIEFHFFGQGNRLEESQKIAEKLGIKVTFKPMVERNALVEHLQSYHLHYVGLRPGLIGTAVPCKVYGIMAAGRAVLAQVPKNSEIALLVNEYRVGVNCSEGNLTEVIRNLLQRPEDIKTWGENGHKYYQAFASLADRGIPLAKSI